MKNFTKRKDQEPMLLHFTQHLTALSLCAALVLLIGCSAEVNTLSDSDNSALQAVAETEYSTDEPSSDEIRDIDAIIEKLKKRQEVLPADIPAALEAAMEENPDVCAWLYLPNTNVSLGIARSSDDDSYYMEHDITGFPSAIGAAFMEANNSPDFDDPVTVLYGHSFPDASIMFTGLHRFDDPVFFSDNEEFCIYLPNSVLTYRIVAACLYNDLHLLNSFDSSNDQDLQEHFDFVTDYDPTSFLGFKRKTESLNTNYDHIVHLSTCTLPASKEIRFVITGVLENSEDR